VRAAIRAAAQGHDLDSFPALATCLRDPAIAAARPLDAVLAGWGRDDLLPAVLLDQVKKAVATAGRA